MRKKEAIQMKVKNINNIIKKIKNLINSRRFMESNRISVNNFSRKRKLPFVTLVLFMLNLVKQTLQKELTQFMNLFSSSTDKHITKSAFCQSRLKLKPEAFVELNNLLVDEFYADNIFKKFMSFRLLAIDGSSLLLPNSDDIVNTFGYLKNNMESMKMPAARISSFYDVLNEIIIDSQIEHYKTSELPLAIKHLEKATKDDLILFDRGYPAVWLFLYLINKNINFVMRLQRNFLSEGEAFFESNKTDEIIDIKDCPQSSKEKLNELGIEFKPFKIRLVKVILDNGEIEVLATTLLNKDKYPALIFKELYFMRWGLEVDLNHLKNHVQLENFTGLSSLSIKQDFYANCFIANLQSIIARDAQLEIKNEKKNTEYEYKVNRNLSLGFMKNKIVEILTSNNPKYMEELKQLFKIEPVPIRKNRKFPRIFHKPRLKYHMNTKKAI
jgi:hypothetical protein